MSEWHDIKTAPRDGTEILIWIPPTDEFGYRQTGYAEVASYWAHPPEYAGFVGVRTHSAYSDATHWMPIEPPAPVVEENIPEGVPRDK